jgi:hypothetical protein
MAWSIEYSAAADKDIAKLDRQVAQRIIKFMGQRVAQLADPRSIGEGRSPLSLTVRPVVGRRAKISALGTYVPPDVMTNKDLEKWWTPTTSGSWIGLAFASGTCWPRGWA